ncbi:MAG: UMP kinase [Chloroflexi bacterium RBG_16_57_8]|nr:MAG: UMP kinase [Chloroflexi bacterium RBG_16_57_8]
MVEAKAKYKRVLLKLSGEAFGGEKECGIDSAVLTRVARQIKRVMEMGVDVGIVVGGGNIFRGAEAEKEGWERVTADYAGMVATLINALALQDRLEREGVTTRTQSAITIQQVAEPYIRRRAIRHLEKGRAVIFACGTGNPYMTTDTAGALRAIEIGAEVFLKATHSYDGIYTADPKKHRDAEKFDKLTHAEALSKRLGVMDTTAVSLCMENNLPIVVFSLQMPDAIVRAASGEPIGTLVTSE